MYLLDLPTELIKSIVWQLDDQASIYSVARTCHLLFDISIDHLYIVNCDRNNGSSIDWAVHTGSIEVLQRVIRLRVPILNQERLVAAVCNDHLDILRLLLQPSPRDSIVETIDSAHRDGISLLEIASGRGSLEMVRELLNLGEHQGREFVPSAIHAAAAQGHSEVVCLLLEYGIDGAAADDSGDTPLHEAVKGNQHGVAEVLLHWGHQSGRVVNALASDLRTPLHIAATIGSLSIVNLLVEHGADMFAVDDEGFTPFLAAVQHDQIQTATALIDRGSEVGGCTGDDMQRTALHLACINGCAGMIEMLLVRGASLSAVDANESTPFVVAVDENQLAAVQILLANGADVNERSGQMESTSLCEAARQGNKAMVTLLLKHGADIEGCDRRGYTALVMASFDGHVDLVRYLLNRGANSSLVTRSKWTALDAAALDGHLEVGKLLLDHVTRKGGTISDLNGIAPVHGACTGGHVDFVKLLLQHQPDALHKRSDNGQLPIHAAVAGGQLEVVQYLLSLRNGPEIDATENTGRTSLFLASRYGYSSIVAYLLKRNASLNIRDKYGASAVSAAARNGHGRVLELLIPVNPEVLLWEDSFGHTPFWWVSRCGTKKVIKLAKRLALDNGISEMQLESYNGHKQHRSFDTDERWCDVCTRSVADCKTAAHCTICYNDDFMICKDCEASGMQCLDAAHAQDKWEREKGCFHCRLS